MAEGKARIDGLRNSDGHLDRQALLEILPYGEEFLFVDRVNELTDRTVEASFRIPPEAPYLQAHFVDLPLMPGVLMGEGLAQAGTVIVRYNLEAPDEHDILAYQIESARFTAPALPGETLRYRVEMLSLSRRAARLEGEADVDGRQVCKARVVVGIVARKTLASKLKQD